MKTTMESYRKDFQVVRSRLALVFVFLAGLLGVCMKLHVGVPWWAVLLLLVVALIGGAGFPAYYRLMHHPHKADSRERRYAVAQLVGRPLGLSLITAGMLALAMGTHTSTAAAPVLVLSGTLLASIPVFFRYKGVQ